MFQKPKNEKFAEEKTVLKKTSNPPNIEDKPSTIQCHVMEISETPEEDFQLNTSTETFNQNENLIKYPVITREGSNSLNIVSENVIKNEYPVITKIYRQESSLNNSLTFNQNEKVNEYSVIKSQKSNSLNVVPENLSKNKYPVITKLCKQEASLNILSSEVNLVKFIKNLYNVQCEVDPIGILNIIPILESSKNNMLYNKNLVDFHVKVRSKKSIILAILSDDTNFSVAIAT